LKLKLPVIFIIPLLFGCQQTKETDPALLVQASTEAHGGIDKWKTIISVSYEKRVVMYHPDGCVESDVIQKIKYSFKPKFSGEMRWKKDQLNYHITFDGDENQLFVDGVKSQNTTLIDKYSSEFMASYYVFAQPFKLLEDKANRTYEGKTLIENGLSADVIKVIYPTQNNEHSDEWWFYFDTNTHRLSANMVHHKKGYSYIINTKYQSVKSLLFNAERKSFNVDSLRNIQYLRADYFLSGFKIN